MSESKSELPIELILADPQVIKIAKEMNFSLDSDEAILLKKGLGLAKK